MKSHNNKYKADAYQSSDFRPVTSSGESTIRTIHTGGWTAEKFNAPDHTQVQRDENKQPAMKCGMQPMHYRKVDRSPSKAKMENAGKNAQLDHMNICEKPQQYRMPTADKSEAALERAVQKDLQDRNLRPSKPLNPDSKDK